MVKATPLAAAAASLLLFPAANALPYTDSSPVIQVDSRSYDSVIARSNHTSIVEFYAPWCGHCKNLQGPYEKAAKHLAGLAKVAAVNCDEETNKPLCGQMGVQGFPTLKIVRPGKKPGRPIVEDYQGQRSAKAIVDAVTQKIPNHVKRLKDADYAAWVAEGSKPKAILFSDKSSTSALLKALAIDFLDVLDVAQIRDKETDAVGAFGVNKFPTLLLLPGDGKEPITYDGEMKKEPMLKFLSTVATPNPDPPKKDKKAKSSSSDKKKASSASSKMDKSSASQKSEESKTAFEASESATPKPTPPKSADAKPIASLPDQVSLQQKCLNDKAGTCVLALLPEEEVPSEKTTLAIKSLSDLHQKHELGKRNLFPFYQIPHANAQGETLRSKLSLTPGNVEIVAVNGKRSWWRHFTAGDFQVSKIEDWVDAIRMGDSPKQKLPDGLIVNAADLPPEPVKYEDPEQASEKATEADPESEQLRNMKEALKNSMPEGMGFEMEELSDEDYEKIMKQGEQAGSPKDGEHDEL